MPAPVNNPKKTDDVTDATPTPEAGPQPDEVILDESQFDGTGIAAAVIEVKRRLGFIPKAGYNTHQRFNFRGIDDVYKSMHPVLAAVGLVTVPRVLNVQSETRVNKNDTLQNYILVTMEYTLTAADGSTISGSTVGEAMDSGDKAANKAMANAHKYFLTQTFSIPTGDPEADGEANEGVPSRDVRRDVPNRPRTSRPPTQPPVVASPTPAPPETPEQMLQSQLGAVPSTFTLSTLGPVTVEQFTMAVGTLAGEGGLTQLRAWYDDLGRLTATGGIPAAIAAEMAKTLQLQADVIKKAMTDAPE